MGIKVAFDYGSWVAGFPQFATIPQMQVTGFILTLAEQCCRNVGGAPVSDATLQTTMLNLMVAHICALFYGVNGQAPSPLVGRITDATEGSVSVSTDFPTTPNNAWFLQSPWGAAYWQLQAPFRTFRYVPGARFSQYGRGVGLGGFRGI